MKKIFVLLFLWPSLLLADTTSDLMGLGMPAALAQKIGEVTGSAVPNSLIPATDNTYDLGSASKTWRTLYTGTSRIAKTSDILRVRQDANRLFTFDASSDTAFTFKFGDGTAGQVLSIGGTSSDGADNQSLQFGASTPDPTRGAYGQLFGNEYGGGIGGAMYLSTGNLAGADLFLMANDDIRFQSAGGTEVGSWDTTTGNLSFNDTTGGNLVFIKALTGVVENIATLAAAGSSQSDATALTSTVSRVTAADGTKGVKLPAIANYAGRLLTIINSDTTNALKVYSNAAGETIDGQAGTTAISVAAKLMLRCWGYDSANWYCEKGVTPF